MEEETIAHPDNCPLDTTNDTEKVKEMYSLMIQVKQLYHSMTDEEKQRTDQIGEHFLEN